MCCAGQEPEGAPGGSPRKPEETADDIPQVGDLDAGPGLGVSRTSARGPAQGPQVRGRVMGVSPPSRQGVCVSVCLSGGGCPGRDFFHRNLSVLNVDLRAHFHSETRTLEQRCFSHVSRGGHMASAAPWVSTLEGEFYFPVTAQLSHGINYLGLKSVLM